MIRIMEAAEGDREEVVSMVEDLLAELEKEPEEFKGIDRAKIHKDLAGAGNRYTAFLAVEDGGRAVGVMTVMESFAIYAGGNYGVIDEMYVAPGYRSRGTGKLLINAAKEMGRRKGWRRIDVTAPPENRWERTRKFYEQQGFVFTGPKLRHRLS
jgi:GNAT superfamily N-acetyltransferase